VPFATTRSIALARLVSYLHVFDLRHAHARVEHDGYCGASLARELGLPAMPAPEVARALVDSLTDAIWS
jgi:hypothetical protein